MEGCDFLYACCAMPDLRVPRYLLYIDVQNVYNFLGHIACGLLLLMFHGLCLSVYLSCAKTSESVKVVLGLWTWVGPRNLVLGGVWRGGNFGGSAAFQVVKILWPLVSLVTLADVPAGGLSGTGLCVASCSLSGLHVNMCVDRYCERTTAADGMHANAVPARQYLPLCSLCRWHSRTI